MTSFKEFATEAAQMENQGQVKEAATAWRRAGAYCTKEQDEALQRWNDRVADAEARKRVAQQMEDLLQYGK